MIQCYNFKAILYSYLSGLHGLFRKVAKIKFDWKARARSGTFFHRIPHYTHVFLVFIVHTVCTNQYEFLC